MRQGLSVFFEGDSVCRVYRPCECALACLWQLYLDNTMHGIDRVCMGINTLSGGRFGNVITVRGQQMRWGWRGENNPNNVCSGTITEILI